MEDPGVQELLHLNFRVFAPCPRLQPWIECYWFIRSAGLGDSGLSERLYPDGGTCLDFDFSDAPEAGLWLRYTHARESLAFPPRRPVDRLGLRFHPGGLPVFLQALPRVPGTAPQRVDLGAFPDLDLLYRELREMTLPETRVTHLETWLLGLAATAEPHAGPLQKLLPRLPLTSTVDSLLAGTGIGRRRFERLISEQVGISPGALRQMLRVKRARYLIKRDPSRSLTDLAIALGYFDQSHFSHQFKNITGETPRAYRRRQVSRREAGQLRVI